MAFRVEETTIAGIHAAYRSGDLTAAELVSRYLARIEAYDRNGPALNSVINVNPKAVEEAEALDEAFAKGGLTGPLHGIPVIVKDQIETANIVTTFGSAAAAGYLPEKDATTIRLMRDAGAIILAKTAMPDFATSWFGYCSAIGATKNPYDLERDPGGSSGGTGCAVAANLGAIGLGEDTGGSARLPASFDNLVGLKVTPGLISRAGMSPLVVFQDSAGPMCRTVTDLAKLLQVIVGFDPEDPYTSTALIAGKTDYVACLDKDALSGKTIGVVRSAFGDSSNPDAAAVNAVVEDALGALRGAGVPPLSMSKSPISWNTSCIRRSTSIIRGARSTSSWRPAPRCRRKAFARSTMPSSIIRRSICSRRSRRVRRTPIRIRSIIRATRPRKNSGGS